MSLQQLQALLQQGQAGQLGGGAAVSFKAGKCKFENQTVTAEARKGEVVITKNDDGIHRFVWRTRAPNPQDVDVFMLIGQISWEKVPECKDARVFALRVGGSTGRGGRLRFYWMQEPKDDKDEQHFKKINELLTASAAGGGDGSLNLGARAYGGPPTGARSLGGALGGISVDNQAALLSMFQQEAAAQRAQQQPPSSSSADASSSSGSASSDNNNASGSSGSGSQAAAQPVGGLELQQAFASAFSNFTAAQQARAANQTPEEKFLHQADHSLADTLDADAIIRLLGNDEAALNQLLPHLPEEERTEEGLRANLRSPQLRQTLDRIQGVLNSGEMFGLLQQLGLPVVNEIGVKALIDSVQKHIEDEKKKNDDGDQTQ